MGWAGTKNGELIELAGANGFEVLVTVDTNLRIPTDAPLSVLVLCATTNRLEALLPLMPNVLRRLPELRTGHIDVIGSEPAT
jgi:hypothetical protein